jgi:hypothetical protein
MPVALGAALGWRFQLTTKTTRVCFQTKMTLPRPATLRCARDNVLKTPVPGFTRFWLQTRESNADAIM